MITVNQAQAALSYPMFLARVEYALVSTAINVSTEASGTAKDPQRVARASLILNNPTGYVGIYAQGVITQLTLSTTNIVNSNTDLDTTDASLLTIISSIWNSYL